jgi:hypothetical protein
VEKNSEWVPFVVIYRFCDAHRLAADLQMVTYCRGRLPATSPWCPFMAIGGIVAGLLLVVFGFVMFLP